MPSLKKVAHNQELFKEYFEAMVKMHPNLRQGSMFGCPAVYVEDTLAFCVFENDLGVKIPADLATSLIESGTAIRFQPYGKRPMKEWVQLSGGKNSFKPNLKILSQSVEFVRGIKKPL
ncbi:MAG: hypothetical protein WCO08_02495 [Actinomycetes bacterium]